MGSWLLHGDKLELHLFHPPFNMNRGGVYRLTLFNLVRDQSRITYSATVHESVSLHKPSGDVDQRLRNPVSDNWFCRGGE